MLGIIHPNKSGSTDPYSPIGLSGAFQGAARVVLLAVEDPDNRDGALLGVRKTKMGRKGMLIGYRVEEAKLDVSDGITTVPVRGVGRRASGSGGGRPGGPQAQARRTDD